MKLLLGSLFFVSLALNASCLDDARAYFESRDHEGPHSVDYRATCYLCVPQQKAVGYFHNFTAEKVIHIGGDVSFFYFDFESKVSGTKQFFIDAEVLPAKFKMLAQVDVPKGTKACEFYVDDEIIH